jgi:hypothetical protein
MLSMHSNSINHFYIINLNYQVVIIKFNHKSQVNMVKYHFYRMTAVNKHHPYLRVLWRFESI